MIYVKSDFLTNYMQALEDKDDKLIMDMLTSEIAYVIIHNKKEFIEKLKQAGFKFPQTISNKKLADVVIENLGNKHMMYTLSYFVAKHNEVLTGAEKNAVRSEEKSNKKTTEDAVKTVAKGIMMIEGELKEEEAAQALVKKRVYMMIRSEQTAKGGGKKKTNKTGKYSKASGMSRKNRKKIIITVSVIGAGVLIFLIARHFYLKNKAKGAAAAAPAA